MNSDFEKRKNNEEKSKKMVEEMLGKVDKVKEKMEEFMKNSEQILKSGKKAERVETETTEESSAESKGRGSEKRGAKEVKRPMVKSEWDDSPRKAEAPVPKPQKQKETKAKTGREKQTPVNGPEEVRSRETGSKRGLNIRSKKPRISTKAMKVPKVRVLQVKKKQAKVT